MGGGRSQGANSSAKHKFNQSWNEQSEGAGEGRRGPNRDPHKANLFVDSGLFDQKELSPYSPNPVSYGYRGTPVFVGDWWRTERL